MEIPEPKVSISKRFDNTVRLRIGGGSIMHPKLRAPTEINTMNANSIFNPVTNYEVEKSEHFDSSMNSQSMDMGNPLLDQSNDLQEFQDSFVRSNVGPMNPKSLTSDNQFLLVSPKKRDSDDGSYHEGMSIKDQSYEEGVERKFSLNK